MMTSISLTSQPPVITDLWSNCTVGTEQGHSTMDNETGNSSSNCRYVADPVISNFICMVCIIGLVGNATVIWLLGFCIKRNSVTTYILNLAVADFGVLIVIPIMYIVQCNVKVSSSFTFISKVVELFYQVVYSASQFLLTAISIDRCVCVLFPLWYRCHRAENLSYIICALVWILAFLVNGICTTLNLFRVSLYFSAVFYPFFLNAVLCLPFITISTLILFIRICFKSQQQQRGKLLMAILLALFFFLILAFPLNIVCLVAATRESHGSNFVKKYFISYGLLCAALNSFVNPLIYFLVGRRTGGLCREKLKLILQRVLTDEEIYKRASQSSEQTQI